jgi:selenocysteine-specific elongation factor
MSESERQYVVGLAGHIDHGKTALVKALTGIDTDSLKEEKSRGITIDLGFAHLTPNITLIDVPGHERLIKNMVAGVSTIDMVLFVIAADDGIMPQTREHLDIVRLLGISKGIFVITKVDLVEPDWIDLVEEELRSILNGSGFEDAAIMKTSTETGEGISEVKKTLLDLMKKIQLRQHDGIFRLPIDRAFLKAGFGSIVTGSVLSGEIKVGDTVEILPEKIIARIRGLQSHDVKVNKVLTGYRAAINLAGTDRLNLYRGQILTEPNYYEPVTSFNAHVQVLPGSMYLLKSQMRIRIHIHTSEVLGRLILMEKKEIPAGENGLVQVRLENPVYLSYRDRFIIRQFSPQITIGGGLVLETNPAKFRKRYEKVIVQNLLKLRDGAPSEVVLTCFSTLEIHPLSPKQLQIKSGLSREMLESELKTLMGDKKVLEIEHGKEKYYCSESQLQLVLKKICREIERYHHRFPGRAGITMAELSSHLIKSFTENTIKIAISHGLDKKLINQTDEILYLSTFQSKLSGEQQVLLDEIEDRYRTSGFNPPTTLELMEALKIKESIFREMVNILKEQRRLVIIDEKIFYHVESFEKILSLSRNFFLDNSEMRVADLKELTGTSRKHAIPLLTYLDTRGYTHREGDIRIAGPKLKK